MCGQALKGGVSLWGNWISSSPKGGNILEEHKLLLMAELLDLLSKDVIAF